MPSITIRPADVHEDSDQAYRGVIAAAEALGVQTFCQLISLWTIQVDPADRESFLELARKEAMRE